jgi:hypothetical protein
MPASSVSFEEIGALARDAALATDPQARKRVSAKSGSWLKARASILRAFRDCMKLQAGGRIARRLCLP